MVYKDNASRKPSGRTQKKSEWANKRGHTDSGKTGQNECLVWRRYMQETFKGLRSSEVNLFVRIKCKLLLVFCKCGTEDEALKKIE